MHRHSSRYKEMKRNFGKIIRRLSKFIERLLSDNQVAVLTHHLSFETMKKNPKNIFNIQGDWRKTFDAVS
jgi:hypothetical protein